MQDGDSEETLAVELGDQARDFLVQQVPDPRVWQDILPVGVEEALRLEVGGLWRDRVVQVPED